jgi:hypothetical protein
VKSDAAVVDEDATLEIDDDFSDSSDEERFFSAFRKHRRRMVDIGRARMPMKRRALYGRALKRRALYGRALNGRALNGRRLGGTLGNGVDEAGGDGVPNMILAADAEGSVEYVCECKQGYSAVGDGSDGICLASDGSESIASEAFAGGVQELQQLGDERARGVGEDGHADVLKKRKQAAIASLQRLAEGATRNLRGSTAGRM